MGLNKEQASAVEYLDGPLLVLAGPGTGKTQLLSAKVAYILEHTDTNPENILCLTFTESGASNMRERLGTMVGRAAAKVNIFTYHAFGSNILERYKNYAENFDRRLDNVIDGVTQYKLIKQIQEQLPASSILKTAKISDLVETIQQAKSARLSSDDLALIAERNQKDSAAIGELATNIFAALKPRMKFDLAVSEVYQPLATALSDLTSSTPIAGNIEPTANILLRDLMRIIETESAAEKPSIRPLSAWKTKHFEKQDDDSFRLKDHIANKKLAELARIMAAYDAELQAGGFFDFADMIEEAIRILREDRGFRLTLSELFQYILLDEFQDTNPSQFELIKLLTDYEKPIVMAVGDDDQAIFEFQGANASNLLDFQNYYQAEIVTLRDNYRSSGEILDFSHRVAEQVVDSFAKQRGVVKVLRSMMDIFRQEKPSTPEPTFPSQIERHEFTAANDEYYWVADQIQDLIRSGESPDNIAIIAPRHKYIAPLLPYFKERGIDISYEKRSNLLDDPKLHELIVIARFCHELACGTKPSHRLLEILSFPFLEVPPLTAIRAVEYRRGDDKSPLDYLTESDDPRLKSIAEWLAALTTESFDAPLELWFDYLIGTRELNAFRSPFLQYYSEHSDAVEQFEFYENLGALRSTVISHTHEAQPHLADFIAMLDDYESASAPIVKTSPYRDSAHSIQIMSAHKSKGLEFKHVFLIAVDELAWGKAKGNNNTFTLPCNLAQIRHTGITDDEQLRLLFVAITRAKQHLVMTNSIQDFSEKTTARLGYLNEQRDEKAERQISPYLPETSQEIQTHYQDFDVDTRLSIIQRNWSATYAVMSPDLRLILQNRLEGYRLTATDLTSFIDLIYAGPEAFYRNRLLRAPAEPLTHELALGNLIHATFEQITTAQLDLPAALEFYHTKAIELPLPPEDIAKLKEQGVRSLTKSYETFEPILHHPDAKAEVNLSSEHLVFEGVPLTGKIDHLRIDPTTKTIEIYDFKTGNFHPEKWQSHPTLYKYAMQLGFYKLLLNLSPAYRNYTVTRGHILFVSPDSANDDQVYDKVLDFDPASEHELRQLIQAVYHEITTLDFLENPAINLPADKKHTLKDIKNFVADLLELVQIRQNS